MAGPWACTMRFQYPVPTARFHRVPSDILCTMLTAGRCTACPGAGSRQATSAGVLYPRAALPPWALSSPMPAAPAQPLRLDSALAGLMADSPGHRAASHPGHHTVPETELRAGDGVAAPTCIPLQSTGLGLAQPGAVGHMQLGVQQGPCVRAGVSPFVPRDRMSPPGACLFPPCGSTDVERCWHSGSGWVRWPWQPSCPCGLG